MKLYIVYASFISLAMAVLSRSTSHAMQARDVSGTFGCYTTTNIVDYSGLCANLNYPIENDMGLSVMGNLYFAMAATHIPDDTVYKAGENIICTVNSRTGNITATVGANAGSQLAGAGASVSFSFAGLNSAGHSICMYTEGTGAKNKTSADPITLGQARNLLLTMLTAPGYDCKTCARIPIRYPEVKDGSSGILKLDVTDSNNCLGKCVGPASFSGASPSPSPSPSPSLSPSHSAGVQTRPSSAFFEGNFLTLATMVWMFWLAVGLQYALRC